MTHVLSVRHLLVVFVSLMLVLLAGFVSAQDTATPEAISEPLVMTFGSGAFNLMSPTAGLSELSSYRATLTLSFDGTNAGQPEQWSRIYTMLVTQTPEARQLTIDNSDAAAQVYMAEVADTFYERQEGESCIAYPIEVEGAFAAQWEPAGFLDSVIGADEAGTETVNDVAANHYTFDERALGASEIADSTGEVWIASDGNYLIRYRLVTTGSAEYFGEGLEGTMTWDYELSDVNTPLAVELPADCPPGLLDVPLLPDAADVVRLPAFTTYSTDSSVEDAIAFYEEQVAAMGGQPANPPLISDSGGMFGFTQGDQAMLVTVIKDQRIRQVSISRLVDPATLAISAEVPDSRGPQAGTGSEETSGECPSVIDTIPLLPDALEVQEMPGLIGYATFSTIEDTIAFFEDEITAAGGTVQNAGTGIEDSVLLEITQAGEVITVNLMDLGGMTNVILTFPPSADAPPTDCATSESAAAESEPVTDETGTNTGAAAPTDCTVSTGSNANERSGPGTNFAVAGTLVGGTSAAVDGQATGADGFVWWRLGDGIWVRSDVVSATGDCDSVPVVTP